MNTMHKLILAVLTTLLSAALVLSINSQLSALDSSAKTLSVALIGDSYTAGNGAGSYNGPSGSYQSSKNWGNRYSAWLKTQGIKVTLGNYARSGDTTEELMEIQIPNIARNTDLVMLTIGGNDAKFKDVILKCFTVGIRSAVECKNKVDEARLRFDAVLGKTREALTLLESRLSPASEVILVGYPHLSQDSNYTLKQCVKFDTHTDSCAKFESYAASKEIRKAGTEFNQMQKDLVSTWNRSHSLKVTFVDTIQSSFSSHEPNPFATGKNPTRWINEFFETEGLVGPDGTTNAKFSLDMNNWYHPNISGHSKIALDIINQVGIPSSAKPITPTSSDIDVAFVIDTTGSMGGSINQVKNDAASIASSIASLSRSSRFALVDYQDHPDEYSTDDYPARLQLPFTHGLDSFTTAVQGLSLGFGGDWEESVHSGNMAALDLDWRPGVRKIAIVIGDAPAKDPEPITGYTWQQVAQRAYDIDPVEIYSIDTGNGALNQSLAELVSQSGGQSFINSGDLSAAIISSINHSLAKPFGWIQGPYITKIGEALELDARGSYVVDGVIEKIEWDLNGDSIFETKTDGLLVEHTFLSEFGGTIGIKITDSNGNVGIGSTRLDVSIDGDAIAQSVDNCPTIANQNQADYDNDGIGDDCDDDIGLPTADMDGVFVTNGEDPDITPTIVNVNNNQQAKTQSSPQPRTTQSAAILVSQQPTNDQFMATVSSPNTLDGLDPRPEVKGKSTRQQPQKTTPIIASMTAGTLVIIGVISYHYYKKRRKP